MLRKLEKKDVTGMLEWMHDEAVNQWFRFDFSQMNEEKALDFIEKSFDEENQNFAIVNENDEYMGTISLKNISKVDNSAEYAVVTRSCIHGTNLAYQATMELLKYAFETLQLERVYLNVLEINGRANRFYEKCGFVYEGMSRNHLYLKGEYRSLKWYSMLKEEYAKIGG